MTNYQCYCYAVKAISNIINAGRNVKLTPDTFYGEIYHLWDIYGERTIEEIVKKELFFDEIKFEIQ